jgi:hypothetical protein
VRLLGDRSRHRAVRYHGDMRALNRPVSWWGWHWEPPVPMSIIELIQAGNLSARLAALFWVALERGASLIVAADPPSSGKTTTLSALLSFTPPDTAVYFTRGEGETFALPPNSPAYRTYLLINEMSDHIPVYTWDDHARRAFELLAEGYSLATTMHADSVQGVLSQLEGDLSIPRRQIANLTFIVPLFIGQRQRVVRRVNEVAFVQPNGADLSLQTIASWRPEQDDFQLLAEASQVETLARWAQLTPAELMDEIERREEFLRGLDKAGTTSVPEVVAAVEGYYEEVVRGGDRR